MAYLRSHSRFVISQVIFSALLCQARAFLAFPGDLLRYPARLFPQCSQEENVCVNTAFDTECCTFNFLILVSQSNRG